MNVQQPKGGRRFAVGEKEQVKKTAVASLKH
jgi:hypothetical protein